MSGFFSLRFFVSLTCSTYHQRVARISSGYPSHSTLAAITKELWTDLHSFELLEVVALSLRSHVEDNLGRTASWEEMKKKTNVYQQYLIAFVESDSAINADGWLVYFSRGIGEMYEEFIGGVTEVGDPDMRKLIVKSVKTIEHPTHWDIFKNLLYKKELTEAEQAQHEHLKGLFASYDIEYRDRRARCAARFEELVRKNQEDFITVE